MTLEHATESKAFLNDLRPFIHRTISLNPIIHNLHKYTRERQVKLRRRHAVSDTNVDAIVMSTQLNSLHLSNTQLKLRTQLLLRLRSTQTQTQTHSHTH